MTDQAVPCPARQTKGQTQYNTHCDCLLEGSHHITDQAVPCPAGQTEGQTQYNTHCDCLLEGSHHITDHAVLRPAAVYVSVDVQPSVCRGVE